jgi:pimeloyl-ACP methyl ester carboxylesterase
MAIRTSRTVTSADGTAIAYQCVGDGRPLILVDGALGFRNFSSSPELARLLAPACRVYAYDRRGRGESGDTQPFSLDREIEDIDALITEAGGSASLYGISSGGALALEAAAKLGDRVEKLAVYEIPYDSSDAGITAYHAYRTSLTQLLAGAGAAMRWNCSCGSSAHRMRVSRGCVSRRCGRSLNRLRPLSRMTQPRSATIVLCRRDAHPR